MKRTRACTSSSSAAAAPLPVTEPQAPKRRRRQGQEAAPPLPTIAPVCVICLEHSTGAPPVACGACRTHTCGPCLGRVLLESPLPTTLTCPGPGGCAAFVGFERLALVAPATLRSYYERCGAAILADGARMITVSREAARRSARIHAVHDRPSRRSRLTGELVPPSPVRAALRLLTLRLAAGDPFCVLAFDHRRAVFLIDDSAAASLPRNACPACRAPHAVGADGTCSSCNTLECAGCLTLVSGPDATNAAAAAAGTSPQNWHVCAPRDVTSKAAMLAVAQRCPGCATWIQRVEGCDEMNCKACHTSFSYNTGIRLHGGAAEESVYRAEYASMPLLHDHAPQDLPGTVQATVRSRRPFFADTDDSAERFCSLVVRRTARSIHLAQRDTTRRISMFHQPLLGGNDGARRARQAHFMAMYFLRKLAFRAIMDPFSVAVGRETLHTPDLRTRRDNLRALAREYGLRRRAVRVVLTAIRGVHMNHFKTRTMSDLADP